MSQAGRTSDAHLGVDLKTLTGDIGAAVSGDAVGNIDLLGVNGILIYSDGTPNTLFVSAEDGDEGAVTTTDAAQTNLLTYTLEVTPGVYLIEGSIAAFNTTDTLGAGYRFSACVRSTGAAATEISNEIAEQYEEGAMIGCKIEILAAANTYLVNVYGLVGKTINWRCLVKATFVT